MPGKNPTSVLVTGASSGIGRACAVLLAQRGYEVFAGVRSTTDGEALQAVSPAQIRPMLLDVTDAGAVERAGEAFREWPLAGLVNNAGIGVVGPLELVPIERVRHQFDVNVIGLLAVTQAVLPALRAGRGRIITVGSIAGRSALPGSGPYDASKFAVEALTDALRMELKGQGIDVVIVEPGAVATEIWRKSLAEFDVLTGGIPAEAQQRYQKLLAKIREEARRSETHAISADAVARAVAHALTVRRPKTRYPLGMDARLLLLLNLLPDRLRDQLILATL